MFLVKKKEGTDVVVDATTGMQRHIEVKEIVKQIPQAHIQQRTVEEIRGFAHSADSGTNCLHSFFSGRSSESIVEQVADVCSATRRPCGHTETTDSLEEEGSENSFEEIMEVVRAAWDGGRGRSCAVLFIEVSAGSHGGENVRYARSHGLRKFP